MKTQKILASLEITNGKSVKRLLILPKKQLLCAVTDAFVLEIYSLDDFSPISFHKLSSRDLMVRNIVANDSENILAVGTSEGPIILFDLSQSLIISSMKGVFSSPVENLKIFHNPDSSQDELVASDSHGKINVWNIAASKLIKEIMTDLKNIKSLQIIQNRKYLACACMDGEISVYNTANWEFETTLSVKNEIMTAICLSDETLICSNGADKIFKLSDFRIESQKFTKKSLKLDGFSSADEILDLIEIYDNDDNSKLLAVTDDFNVLEFGICEKHTKFSCYHGNLTISSSIYFLDEKYCECLFIDSNGRFIRYNIQQAKAEVHTISTEFSIKDLYVDSNTRRITLFTTEGHILIYGYKDLSETGQIRFLYSAEVHSAAIECLVTSEANENLFVTGARDGILKLSLFDDENENIKPIAAIKAHSKEIYSVIFGHKNKTIITCNFNGFFLIISILCFKILKKCNFL